ncbi:MAG: hypothetical protein ABR578_05520 [Chromatocurvus sp.]
MATIALLLVSVLTPWLAGFALLRAAESCTGYRPHPARQIAFGFFFGYSLLQFLVISNSAVFGHIPVLGINIGLAVIAVAAHLVYRRSLAASDPASRRIPINNSDRTGWIFWLFLGLALLHLLLAAVEVLHRPIFPWDAWLSWMYRAKAWFFAGSILPMDSPPDWLNGTGESIYNVAGAQYPSLVPITALWSALNSGQWSETQVNVPVIACGMALGAGIYGLSREAGRSRQTSMIAAYLVLSIPLIGTHLSLAGQADIWVAGYAGLGAGACLLGLMKKIPGLFLVGLALTALSMGVKAEGGVWLAVILGAGAMTWLLSARRWRYLVLLPVAIGLLWLLDIRFFELPLVGGVGIKEGTLHAAFLGSHRLEWHNVLGDYWQNFFRGGSWHLLWPLLILVVFARSGAQDIRERTVTLAFLFLVVASQAIIFGATSQGRWAEDWTAINRIPLHLAPALVFCLALAVPAERQAASGRRPLFLLTASAGVAALFVTGAAAVIYLGAGFVNESGAQTTIKAANHRLVMGRGELKAGPRHITRFDNNVALVSSGPISVNAAEVSLASIHTSGDNRNGQNFFWRRASDPEDLKMLQSEGRGTTYLRLRDNPDWSGTITEIGLVFYDDGGSLTVGDMSVMPDSLASRLRQAVTQWGQMTPWSQKSTHWLPAGAHRALLSLPLLLTAWLLITIALIVFAARKSPKNHARSAAIAACIVAWLVLDLRWMLNQGVNTLDTVAEHSPGSSEPLRFGGDKEIRRAVQEATSRAAMDNATLLITADDERMRYQMLRAKYHALPTPVYVHERARSRLPAIVGSLDVLVLKQPYRDPAAPATRAAEWQQFLAGNSATNESDWEVAWEGNEGFFLRHAPVAGERVPSRLQQ